MAEVIPFRGICFNPRKVEAAMVTAPPYDIISPEMRKALYLKSLYNIARIDAGEDLPGDTGDENKYTRAAELFQEWLDEGVLKGQDQECFYAYETEYISGGEKKTLKGFFGLVRLEPFGSGSIYPHEATHSKARTDRLNLLKATRANTSPVFSIYDSPDGGASRAVDQAVCRPPFLEAPDPDGFKHKLWVIDQPADIEAIKSDLRDKPVFIADGHHRYETALENKRQMCGSGCNGDEHYNYVLMFLANISGGGLTILPTHRLVETGRANELPDCLAQYFDIEQLRPDEDMPGAIRPGKDRNVLGLLTGKGKYRLAFRDIGKDLLHVHPSLKHLDVVILHELVFKKLFHPDRVVYEMSAPLAEAQVAEGLYQAAFFLNPTGVADVKEAALAGQRMPPKSTYFYPKIMTGFVMSRF
ncbi:MAG: DUF1015 domain-containing protein [Nitrospiraceae bacterium]|nr:DUF1015 domain-containing protein [Nitrospiraceae bacterium]